VDQLNYRDQARSYVHKHFPSLENTEPRHTTRLHGQIRLHVYTFQKECSVPGGVLSQMVRVFVSTEGKIVKAISSR